MVEYKLFLDDIRRPIDAYYYTSFSAYKNEDWEIVRSYNQFVNYISSNYDENKVMPSIIGFDHDLADEHYSLKMNNKIEYEDLSKSFKEKTGMDCAKWLVEFCMDNNVKLPNWFVHSMNPVGKENIDSYLLNYKENEKL